MKLNRFRESEQFQTIVNKSKVLIDFFSAFPKKYIHPRTIRQHIGRILIDNCPEAGYYVQAYDGRGVGLNYVNLAPFRLSRVRVFKNYPTLVELFFSLNF